MASKGNDVIRCLFQTYSKLLETDLTTNPIKFTIPIVSSQKLIKLCETARDIFRKEPMVLESTGPVIVVGDLHGHLFDLISIIKKHGLPARQRYVFLGDIVDRGDFSLTSITLIFLFKVLWPQNCLLIRGNHEFHFCTQKGGFEKEVTSAYSPNGQSVYLAFQDAFSYIPLAAVLNKNIITIHAGIGPKFTNIQQLNQIQRPLDDFGDEIVDSALWSDPDNQLSTYEPSRRGTGFLFGQDAFQNFLTASNCQKLIRGHECVMGGVEPRFNKTLYTVFSAANYCGSSANLAGIVLIDNSGNLVSEIWEPNETTIETRYSKEQEPCQHSELTEQEQAIVKRIQISKQPSLATY